MINAADHLGLVHRIARRYRWACCAALEYEDLVQLGTLGLLRAVEKFDPDRGVAFSTYASRWIKHTIRRGIQNQRRLVAVPVAQQAQAEWLPPEVTVGIADKTGDGRLAVVLGSPPPPHLGEAGDIAKAFAAMRDERTQDVVWLRMHAETLDEIGADLGVTRQRAAQIEAAGIAAARCRLGKPRRAFA
jgi:RNA polymerase sigma factor (sigma-70 family)